MGYGLIGPVKSKPPKPVDLVRNSMKNIHCKGSHWTTPISGNEFENYEKYFTSSMQFDFKLGYDVITKTKLEKYWNLDNDVTNASRWANDVIEACSFPDDVMNFWKNHQG